MRKITMFETSDGALHATEKDARRYAENRFGDKVTAMAHVAARIEKYSSMCDWLESSLSDFAELIALRADADTMQDETEGASDE